jgi:heptosyltransferase III
MGGVQVAGRLAPSPEKQEISVRLPKKGPVPEAELGRVLVVQLGRLGDVVASRIALHSLGAAGAEVELLAPAGAAELFAATACSPAVHDYPPAGPRRASRIASLISVLRARRFDLVLDLTGSSRSRWICALAGARRRAGWGRRWLYAHGTPDRRRGEASLPHEIGRLVEALGVPPRLDPPPLAAPPMPPALLALAGTQRRPVVLHPGASNPIRLWPGGRFGELAQRLRGRGHGVLLIGGPEEGAATRALAASASPPLPLFEPRGLGELMAALAAARLFIGLDSGPMHLAAALGVPTLALFGPNLPARSAPASGPLHFIEVELPCRPCRQILSECVLPGESCMHRITPEAVYARADALLGC